MNSIYHLRTPDRTPSGFALVTTLLLLALLVVVMGALASFVSVSQRSAGAEGKAYSAQQSALVGLNVALGELQAAAGPDQRVTATASILGHTGNGYTSGTTSAVGRGAWTGVWKSNTNDAPDGEAAQYSPKFPDTKAFAGWLVSATDVDGNFTLPGNLTDVSAASYALADPMTLFAKPDGSAYIEAGKVHIDDVRGGKRYFAFAVEDEGVKADLSWSETPASLAGTERAQASRLSAAPGPDYAMLNGSNGPFGSVTHPLNIDSNPFLSDAIAPMRDPADLQISLDANPEWLKEQRADITWGSRGVLADVKLGGLRRDLSLAFEMDGDADVTASEQPTLFNQQEGEFVGGADRLAAPTAASGMGGVKERFLYRDYRGTGTPFSNDIQNVIYKGYPSVVRGPTWWAMRDYYNLYKRLRGASGNYAFDARAYYPNASVGDHSYHYGSMHGVHNARTWDVENYNDRWGNPRYIFKPARASYAPVLLGTTAVFSVLAKNSDGTEADLALGIDPFFFLWNPYNRKLKVDNYAMVLTTFPGHITFEVEKTDGTGTTTTTRYGPATVSKFFQQQVRITEGWQGHFTTLSYMAHDLTMEPGEVVVLSPRSNRNSSRANEFHDELFPGTNTDNESGAILTSIPDESGGNWSTVKLTLATDRVKFLYSTQYFTGTRPGDTGMSEHCWTHVSMPPPGTIPKEAWENTKRGEHLQQLGGNVAGDRWSIPLHFRPDHRAGSTFPPYTGEEDAAALVNTKRFFGISSGLVQPSAHDGVYPNPVEIFTQFNPFRMAGYSDLWRPCLPNETYSGISDPGDVDALLLEAGINWPAVAGSEGNGFWGKSYTSNGSTSVPISNIPSSPILSLAGFCHGNFGVGYWHPFQTVGNSWASVFVSPTSPYGPRPAPNYMGTATASDSTWLLNDALFDRYYLSGIAPEFTIGTGGYSATGSLGATLTQFYGADYQSAKASPALEPYIPGGKTSAEIVAELTPTLTNHDGYKKLGAYSLVKGAFNVNSTSVKAWEAFLRANRNINVDYAQGGGTDTGSGSPFPSSASPPAPGGGASAHWSGFSRLTDAQITALATEIVNQVKLRGPFMSLSDFVNHRVGTPKNDATHYMGAIQAAIEADAVSINQTVQSSAGGLTPTYSSTAYYAADTEPGGDRKSTVGIPGDITQAGVLLPLAPRLTARSDTFRIRSYGEVRSRDGTRIISKAMCEAIVQRVPEYMDPETDAEDNEPWDEAASAANFNEINKKFGRRFKVVQLRWLAPDEI